MTGWGSVCSIEHCKNNGKTKKARPELTFHRFPKDVDLKEKWVELCGRKQSFSIESAVICSDHFAPDDYKRNLQAELLGESRNKKLLLPDAVPSKNLPPGIENKGIKVLQKNRELSEEEKIAKRKALVEDAIKWAESLTPKRPNQTRVLANEALNISQKLQKFTTEPQKIQLKRNFILDTPFQKKKVDVQKSTQVPKINSIDPQQVQVERIDDVHGCSGPNPTVSATKIVKSASAQTVPLPVLRPVGIMEQKGSGKQTPQTTATSITLPSSAVSSRAFSENEAFADKIPLRNVVGDPEVALKKKCYELELKYADLETKYKRCYKTLCCFKTAYTKLKSQNITARNKITELRQKTKTLDRQLKEKRKNKKHKLVQTISTATATASEDEDDVGSWW